VQLGSGNFESEKEGEEDEETPSVSVHGMIFYHPYTNPK
jgi:hypothetical protein